MAVADLIPSLTDAELANLNANVRRIGDSGTPAQKAQAAELAPLIAGELAERVARKPVKAKPRAAPKAPRKPKAAAKTAAKAEA